MYLSSERKNTNNVCIFTTIKSFNDKLYICNTCHTNIKKNRVPCQAVENNLAVDDIPPELSSLEKLEQILISQRIVFEKIVIMPKGQQRRIKGAICNAPVNCEETCTILPRPPHSSGIIMLTLKRKLQFRGHVYFQAVRPQLILNALRRLQMNNPLYENTITNLTNIDSQLTNFSHLEDQPYTDGSYTCSYLLGMKSMMLRQVKKNTLRQL